MKKFTLPLVLSVAVSALLLSCAAEHKPISENGTAFNVGEFTGLIDLSTSYSSIKLDYELDNVSGVPIKFSSCLQVGQTKESNIQTDQFKLFRLLQINCYAAEIFFKAKEPIKTLLPKKMDSAWINSMPAQAVPDIGGGTFSERANRTLAQYEKNILVKNIDKNITSISLGEEMEINYIVMARGDFNGDLIEDLLVRIDWNIPNSFGNGFDLIQLSKTSSSQNPKISWRAPKP